MLVLKIATLAVFCACSESDPAEESPDASPPAPDASVPYECTGEDTHYLSGYWPRGSKVEVIDFTGAASLMVEQAVADWNSLGIPMELVYLRSPEDPLAAKIIVRVDPDGQFLGFAWSTKEDDGEIIAAEVLISQSMFGWPEEARRHVVCQEIGHALGLAHVEGVTCMDDCSRFLGTGTSEFADCLKGSDSVGPDERDRCQLELNADRGQP